MRKLILSAAILFFSVASFAQQKEIEAAYSAIETNDIATAKANIAQVQTQIDSKTVSPELKAKYYYTSGKIAMSEGQSIAAAKSFGQLSKYENGIWYSIRNKDTKDTEYYISRAEAETASTTGNYTKPKEIVLKSELITKVEPQLRTKAESLLNQGSAALQANRNKEAGDKFLEASYLVEAMGGEFNLFRYNAALCYHKADDFQTAFDIYKELIDSGFTGESSSWVGTLKETGEEITFANKEEAEMQQKLGVATGVKQVKTESVERSIYSYTLNTLVNLKKYDDVVEKISTKYPNDSEIQTQIGDVYFASGKMDLFETKLIEGTKIDPKNPNNYYNLGVINKDRGDEAQAKTFFEKAIQVDPTYKNGYLNLALLIIQPEKEYVDIINKNLGTSAKEKGVYKEYTEKRKAMYIEAIPYFEKLFNLDKTDYNSAKMLRQAYQAAEMFDMEDEMRAIEKSLQ